MYLYFYIHVYQFWSIYLDHFTNNTPQKFNQFIALYYEIHEFFVKKQITSNEI